MYWHVSLLVGWLLVIIFIIISSVRRNVSSPFNISIWYFLGWGQGQISNMKVMVNGMVIMSVYKGPVVSEDINLSNNPHINFFQKYRAQCLGEKSTYCERKITVLKLLWYFLFTFINCRWVTIKCNYCKVSNDSTLHQGSSVIMCQKSAACKC